jgi:hypothetical protein
VTGRSVAQSVTIMANVEFPPRNTPIGAVFAMIIGSSAEMEGGHGRDDARFLR